MSYSNNPLLPKARAFALKLLIEEGLPPQVVANRCGVDRSTIYRWKQRWLELNQNIELTNKYRPNRKPTGLYSTFKLISCKWNIPTLSSKPHRSPAALPKWVVDRIIYWRSQHDRCAAIVHAHLRREGVVVSLSSVKRVLERLNLLRSVSKWKKYRPHIPRPLVKAPGDLVQTDTVHLVDITTKQRVYLFTLIDVYSRWTYAEYHEHLSQQISHEFLRRGEAIAGFKFKCVQSDNGPEFGRWLNDQLKAQGTVLRHSRVRRPNDNAFIERFNRTIQEEGLKRLFPNPETVCGQLAKYLAYYNQERLHSSLQYRTPAEMLQRS
jgi:transposase InsO family protein